MTDEEEKSLAIKEIEDQARGLASYEEEEEVEFTLLQEFVNTG